MHVFLLYRLFAPKIAQTVVDIFSESMRSSIVDTLIDYEVVFVPMREENEKNGIKFELVVKVMFITTVTAIALTPRASRDHSTVAAIALIAFDSMTPTHRLN